MKVLRIVPAAMLLAAALVLPATTAQATGPDVVAASTAAMWQTNGKVSAMVYAQGVLWVGGSFTSVRPPGAAPGSGEVARRNLAAFDSASGQLLPISHNVDNEVKALEVAPDRSTIYAGGKFKVVDGKQRLRVAAFSASTGAMTAFAPRIGYVVHALAVSSSTVYVGGEFGAANGQTRKNLAAYSRAGQLLPWAPIADRYVRALLVSPDGLRVIVGGNFDTINGTSMHGLASLDAVTGANMPWQNGLIPPNSGSRNSQVTSLATDGQILYVGAEGTGGGMFDGTLAARFEDGSLVWRNNCLGATQDVLVVGNALYKASHAHDCSSAGAFGQIAPGEQSYHLLAQSLTDGRLLHWFPNTNGGGPNGTGLGPYVFATDGTQLFVGGEFTSVNNVKQQGIARFPKTPDSTRPGQPRMQASSTETGQVDLQWNTVTDDDDETLRYDVYRDSTKSAPVYSVTRASKPWIPGSLNWTDTGLAPGSQHSYWVRASDGTNSGYFSPRVNVTATATNAGYAESVLAHGPTLAWRLGEAGGASAQDATPADRDGTYYGGVARGVSGALLNDSDTAVSFDGQTGYVASEDAFSGPASYTVETWFRTTTSAGGKLIGFGNRRDGASTNYDRHVYMTNAGRLVFGTWTGSASVVTSSQSYNDGEWHHVAGTQDGTGTKLYVDGQLVGQNATTGAQQYTGYWRVGGDNLNGWPERPTSSHLAGRMDEVAVYPYALSNERVAQHVRLSGR